MLAGLGVLLIVTPVNAILVRWCRQASKLGMEEKDKRMKLMNEILNGIKVGPSAVSKISIGTSCSSAIPWPISLLQRLIV